MSEPLIAAVDLSKVYADGDRVEVLDHLDLSVEAGEKVAIVGESGVGKSTLLHLLGALDYPTGGRVLFGGADIFALDEKHQAAFRNTEIGFVFQLHHLLPDFSALENVMMPALVARWAWDKAERQARRVLERVGLGHRLEHRPGELSGGEQQRVAVARAVVLSPRAILADEPTGNLDPVTGEGVHQLLIELNREHGITLVIVTHNERLAAQMDRSLHLVAGKVR